ncbi:NAD(P)H:quinone oxidoreductase type IV [Desertivirga arenae]|uniref:NAD(P)H:quinone oxidoreductase type IV n=1 Tax=Desertivirga arenae TaxID=2810309 RepID=UPI001A96D106|nr:NAD(P)H:quinone oxidoreductase type IV [Pedobacter sp. SYSU D00823]
MENVKLAVIYYSSTGTNYQLAQWAAEAAKRAGAEARILKIAETAPDAAIQSNPAWAEHVQATASVPTVTLEDLEWADALIFSFPTRFGNPPSQFRSFIDTTGGLWFQGKLANKVVSAMTSAQNPHGGQESTLLSFYITMFHWGAIIAAPGYTSQVIFGAGGNPYGTSVTVTQDAIQQGTQDAVAHQAERTVEVAKWVKTGKNTTI